MEMSVGEITVPLVKEVEIKEQTGRIEAEEKVRFMAHQGDAAAVAAVAKLDELRAKFKRRKKTEFAENAKALGLSTEAMGVMLETLRKDTRLLTWLSQRVHVAMAHDRPLAEDE